MDAARAKTSTRRNNGDCRSHEPAAMSSAETSSTVGSALGRRPSQAAVSASQLVRAAKQKPRGSRFTPILSLGLGDASSAAFGRIVVGGRRVWSEIGSGGGYCFDPSVSQESASTCCAFVANVRARAPRRREPCSSVDALPLQSQIGAAPDGALSAIAGRPQGQGSGLWFPGSKRMYRSHISGRWSRRRALIRPGLPQPSAGAVQRTARRSCGVRPRGGRH